MVEYQIGHCLIHRCSYLKKKKRLQILGQKENLLHLKYPITAILLAQMITLSLMSTVHNCQKKAVGKVHTPA